MYTCVYVQQDRSGERAFLPGGGYQREIVSLVSGSRNLQLVSDHGMGVAYCLVWRIPTREILSSALSRRHARTRARYRTPPHASLACPRSPGCCCCCCRLSFSYTSSPLPLSLLSLAATARCHSADRHQGITDNTVEKFQGEIGIDRGSAPKAAPTSNVWISSGRIEVGKVKKKKRKKRRKSSEERPLYATKFFLESSRDRKRVSLGLIFLCR